MENHRPSAEAKKLTVDRPGRRPSSPCTPTRGRLRQALDNLLSNADQIHAGGRHGHGGRASTDGDRIVIEVSDTGIGIPAEQYPHLFSRFFRASNATEAGIKGTGLGLAVTKAIIDGARRHDLRGPGARTAAPRSPSGCRSARPAA